MTSGLNHNQADRESAAHSRWGEQLFEVSVFLFLIVMHFLQDFLGVVLLPLLGMK